MPKTGVNVSAELVGSCQGFHRLLFPDGFIAGDKLADVRRQQEKSPIDPAAVVERLLAKTFYAIALYRYGAESLGRAHRGDRRRPAVRPVKRQFRGQIDIRDPIAVSERKDLFVAHVMQHPLETAAGHRVVSGIDQGDPPRL